MIVLRLCGGLGNQLFQYALGRKLALNHQTELVLDKEWYKSTPASNTLRNYELGRYPIIARDAIGNEKLWCRFHSSRILGRTGIRWGGWSMFRERGFDFDNTIFDLTDNTFVFGYWQSHLYIDDIADRIRIEFIPIIPPSLEDVNLIGRMQSTNSVSVHIRRGDYVTQKAATTVHGSCSEQYYVSAVEKTNSLLSDPHYFVFSDDMEWVKKNMVFPGSTTYVEHNDSNTAFQDLRLMSTCKHHIIANSSFSWWGAWLNSSQEKMVIAPAVWFADRRPTPHLMPKSWIRI
jgi:hypothetical protein